VGAWHPPVREILSEQLAKTLKGKTEGKQQRPMDNCGLKKQNRQRN